MQPNKTSPLTLFSQSLQYLVPIFQRGYVWTVERQIQPLWADIVDRIPLHTSHASPNCRA